MRWQKKRGLISLEVGRGSFVRSFESRSNELGKRRNIIDLGLNLPPVTQHADLLSRTLAQISNSRDIVKLFGNAPVESFEQHANAAAKWLSDRVTCSAEDVLICSGTQNALVALLSTLTKPHESVLVEALTFPGMIAAAKLLHLKPDSNQDGWFRNHSFRIGAGSEEIESTLLYPRPTRILQQRRCRKLVARKLRRLPKDGTFPFIEDDVYGKLVEDSPQPIATFAPERTILVSSLAKTLSVGLRLAFVRVPAALREAMMNNMRATNFFPSPLLSEIAARWINDETANCLLQEQRETAQLRQKIAREILPEKLVQGKSAGNHLWLNLPEAWSADTLERAARENGVNLYSAELFVPTGLPTPKSVRVALGAARNESELRIGLNVISRLLTDEGRTTIGSLLKPERLLTRTNSLIHQFSGGQHFACSLVCRCSSPIQSGHLDNLLM